MIKLNLICIYLKKRLACLSAWFPSEIDPHTHTHQISVAKRRGKRGDAGFFLVANFSRRKIFCGQGSSFAPEYIIYTHKAKHFSCTYNCWNTIFLSFFFFFDEERNFLMGEKREVILSPPSSYRRSSEDGNVTTCR